MYYVYVLIDPRKQSEFNYEHLMLQGEPFYVGYGHNNRVYKHFQNIKNISNPHKTNKIKSIIKDGYDKNSIIHIFKENLTKEEATNLEIELIYKIGRHNLKEGPLTNLTSGGDGGATMTGKNHSEETRQKISKSKKNQKRIFTDTWCKNIGLAATGRKHSEETKGKISDSNKGKKVSKETREKISNGNIGKIRTEKFKENLRIKMTGKNMNLSDESRKKISATHKGKEVSELTKKKISESMKGRTLSDMTKEKISLAKKNTIIDSEWREKMRLGKINQYKISGPNIEITVYGIKEIYEYFKTTNKKKEKAERLRGRSAYNTVKTKIPYKGWLITKI